MTIKIFYKEHVLFGATVLRDTLIKLGYSVQLTKVIEENDNSLYVIYCAFMLKSLPKNYIVYQTEVSGSHWFNDDYLNAIKGAIAVWDYSPKNSESYSHEKTFIVPVGYSPQTHFESRFCTSNKDIDVLFYGSLNNHRKQLIDELKEHFEVTVIQDTFGYEMSELINRAKVVLNIHYYPNAPIEQFRINEALSNRCIVVSEREKDCINSPYDSCVYWFKGADDLINATRNALNRKFDFDIKHLSNESAVKFAIEQSIL